MQNGVHENHTQIVNGLWSTSSLYFRFEFFVYAVHSIQSLTHIWTVGQHSRIKFQEQLGSVWAVYNAFQFNYGGIWIPTIHNNNNCTFKFSKRISRFYFASTKQHLWIRVCVDSPDIETSYVFQFLKDIFVTHSTDYRHTSHSMRRSLFWCHNKCDGWYDATHVFCAK